MFPHKAQAPTLRHLARPALALMLCACAAGCAHAGYYLHVIKGQYQVLQAREPIAGIVADPKRDPELRRRLALVLEGRRYASAHLALPDNGSYTTYADLHRPYVVWNVFAAPEFSLKPKTYCFPIAGCVAYRGYYDEARAREFARHLKTKDYDVYVAGVAAYSTLGWFDDPVLNTMLRWDDDTLAGTVFHELAHQKLYLKGDTAFNESFATFVEREGTREFRAGRGEPLSGDPQTLARERQFVELVLKTRDKLAALYASGLPQDQMRARKHTAFDELRVEYAVLRKSWDGYAGYDAWFAGPLNNAKLLPVGLYHQWVPAFARLFADAECDWKKFYARVEAMANKSESERRAELEQLSSTSASSISVSP